MIDDYADTAGGTRGSAARTAEVQEGDPARAAAIIVDLVQRDDLPQRLQLGADSYDAVADKVALVAREQAEWRDVSLSTAFPDADASVG